MNFKRNIMITGGAGFIGSHVVRLFVNKYPDYRIINLDKLTYAGNLANLKDIEDRQSRKENDPKKRKVNDIVLLKTIARYLASVIGSPVSIKSVADYLISSGRKVSTNTVSDYMEALIESYVFYPAERFDIVGKQLLKSNRKMYMVDLGLRNHILPRRRYDLGFSIENMVYFELLRRGYQVAIGKNGAAEVDFVARKQGILTYYQVTADMTAEEVKGAYERETGEVIVRRFEGLNPVHTPGVLVKNHGPFAWGKDAHDAVHNAVVMEQVAKMACFSYLINPQLTMNPLLVEKHFSRKHGPNAYYGQKK